MVTKITDIICEYLNGYCSSKIWNDPQLEYRHNIKLILQEARPRTSTWQRAGENVILPDSTNQYFVYATPLDFFGLDVGSADWRSVSTLLMGDPDNDEVYPRTNIQLRVHDSTGKRLMSDMVFLKSSSMDPNTILIAVDTSMLKKVSDVEDAENDLYIGVYYDSDTPNNISIKDFTVNRLNVNEVVQAAENANIKFVNGYAVRTISSNTLVIGDMVELVKDDNIVFSFSMDMANDDVARIYRSNDGQEKYIIHIPKELNPNNAVISHDTCDFYIYPRNASNKDIRGRFFHRCQGSESKSFIQLTHNDFGVPTSLVDLFAGYCDSNEVVIECFVRRHAHNKFLVQDRNYINYLYLLNDNQILDFLEGIASVNIRFWNANILEGSNFTAIMKDTSNQRLQYTVDQYTEALGYLNTAALLCPRIYRFTGENASSTTLTKTVVLPLIYQYKVCPVCQHANTILDNTCSQCNADITTELKLSAIVTLNGKKIPFNRVKTTLRAALAAEEDNAIKMVVTVTGLTSDELREANDLVIEVVELNEFESYLVTIPSDATNLSYLVRAGEYNFYRVGSITPVKIPNGSISTTYTKVESGITIEEFGSLSKVTFSDLFKGNTILIQSKAGSYFEYRDISAQLEADNALVFIPKDSAQIVDYIDFTPASEHLVYETNSCDDFEVYAYNSETGKYKSVTATDGYFNVEDIGNNKKRITFTQSTIGTEFKIFVFDLEDVPVLDGHELSLYMNGLNLVENVDYWKKTLADNLPPVYIVQNISYLKENGNYLEAYESDMEKVVYGTNFIASDYINSKRDPVLYYEHFTNAFIGGHQHGQLDWNYGRLSSICDIYSRKSGRTHYAWKNGNQIVYTATMPPKLDDYIFGDLDGLNILGRCTEASPTAISSDTLHFTRFTAGDVYYTRNDTNRGALYEVKTFLPITVRAVLRESYLAADLERFKQIVDYFVRLTPDDPDRYTMPYSHHIASVYLNAIVDDILDGRLTIPANTDISYILPYLTDYDYLKPFDLALSYKEERELTIDGNESGRVRTIPTVDRKFVDVFPSYKQRLVPGSTMYQTLLSVIDYFTIKDTVVDTEGVDTTVDTNRS